MDQAVSGQTNMSKLAVLRLFVDQRLAAATDDIFRRFARTITEYEREVFHLKQEIERQKRLLATGGRPGLAPGDAPGDKPADVLQLSTTEEQRVGRSFSPNLKWEGGGASRSEVTDTQSPDWLTRRPETDRSPASDQIQSGREETGSQPDTDEEEVIIVKQEEDGRQMLLETAVSRSRQKGVQVFGAEEEHQVRGRGFRLHMRQEEGESSGQGENKFMRVPDWLMESYGDEGSSSSNHIPSHSEEDLLPAQSDPLQRHGRGCTPGDYNMDSIVLSESCTEDSDDAQMEPGLTWPGGTGTWSSVDQKLLVCSSCGREFSSKRTLRKHVKQNTSPDTGLMSCSFRRQRAPFQNPAKSFSCTICGSSFSTQGILIRHAENHCKEPESRCGACGDHLESTDHLREHLRTHKELGSTCDVCGKKCSSIKRMEIHKRVHTGEKPYRCEFCSRDFSRKESLERHLKIHSGDRPHGCGICRRTFTRREYLIHHLKTGHTDPPGPAEPEAFSLSLLATENKV